MDARAPLDRLELLQTLSSNNFGIIRLTDRKAQVLLRLALTLFMVAFIGVPPAVMALRRFLEDGGWKAVLFVGVVALYLLCSVCLIFAIMRIIAVIRPRVETNEDVPGRLYFGAIAQMKAEDFRRTMHEVSPGEVVEDLISQVYSTSVIATHKINQLNRAIGWMMSGGVFGVAFALILLISVGLGADTPQPPVVP